MIIYYNTINNYVIILFKYIYTIFTYMILCILLFSIQLIYNLYDLILSYHYNMYIQITINNYIVITTIIGVITYYILIV